MIGVGTDHAGMELKDRILAHLRERGVDVRDFGPAEFDPDDDYPDLAVQLARAVAAGEISRGILVCGTGIGMSIAANKVRGVRAALCVSSDAARLSREHNNANVLVLAGRDAKAEDPLAIVDVWVDTVFPGEKRHARRIDKIARYETDE